MPDSNEPVIIIGTGVVAQYALDIAIDLGRDIMGFVDDNRKKGEQVQGFPVLGGNELIEDQSIRDQGSFVIASGDTKLRAELYSRLAAIDLLPTSLIHPSCTISSMCEIGPGAIISPFTAVRPDADIGPMLLVEGHSRIGFGNQIGENVVITTGVMLNGNVKIGNGCFIGSGSVFTQGVEVGDRCFVAAGSVVIKNVPTGKFVAGNPGRSIKDSPLI
jgi:sugar O-acyltransferase (sialic acid O-acetyltransferase NeuD family)